jgi:peptidyl-tRNA hydrolase, PTH1 family
MKIIFGLGNPGKNYEFTRHNIGFVVLDFIAKKLSLEFTKFYDVSLNLKTNIENESVIFSKPITFMNLSGTAVRKNMDYYKVEPKDILVIVDDINLELGNIRFREKGSAGGHNGLKSIIEHLGTNDFSRLRIGISAPANKKHIPDFVLSKFSQAEKETTLLTIEKSFEIIELWLNNKTDEIMQKFHKKNSNLEGKNEKSNNIQKN